MNGQDKVIKHLEMIQGVINRLGSNSFMLKSWSMTMIAAAVILTARYDLQDPFIILAFIIPILGFGVLDGYFLRQEKLFRDVYNKIRKQEDTDFAMDVIKHADKPKINLPSAMFSFLTLIIFYMTEAVFVATVFGVLK